MSRKQEVMLMDKGFLLGVIDTLKTLDVRGYESNKKLVICTMELERALNTPLPLTVEPNEKLPKQEKVEAEPIPEIGV